MKRLSTFAACVCLSFASISFAQEVSQEKIVTIDTGPVNGVYYPAGGAVCRLMNRNRKETNIHCFAESTNGSLNNIQALKGGEANFAIAQSDWQYKAYAGQEAFADAPFTELRSGF